MSILCGYRGYIESFNFLLSLLVFVCALLIANIISSTSPNITATGETKPLYLLTLVPYPDSRNTARLEERLGTIPGANVAQDEIQTWGNSNSNSKDYRKQCNSNIIEIFGEKE